MYISQPSAAPIAYLCMRVEVRHSGVEVGQFLVLVTSEDEHLVLEEGRKATIVPHTEILRLSTYLSYYVGVEPSYRVLRETERRKAIVDI